MLKEGDLAPEFELESNMREKVSLKEDCAGKKVILYFYPKDNTPGCTLEAKDFENLKETLLAHDTIILGVSKDDIESHNKFADNACLSFELLSDSTGQVCEAYGVWVEKSMYGKKYMGIERSTFIIDENRRISKIWRKVDVKNHAADVMQFIAKSN
jgi:thioredoxin-dependent peroxiredoxin